MRGFAIMLSILYCGMCQAEYLRCKGNIPFWIETKKNHWKKIEASKAGYFEDYLNKVPLIKVGKSDRFPAAIVNTYPPIFIKIINKDIKTEIDQNSSFEIFYQNDVLKCEINSGGGMI